MPGREREGALRPYLFSGERLLWTGAPAPGLRFAGRDIFLIPFSLVWLAFVTFWNVMVWRMGAPREFALFGLPFLAVGLYVTFGRFAVEAWMRRRTLYGLSNRRVLILRRPPFGRFRSFEIGYLPLLEYEEHRSGRGTIRFDEENGGRPWWLGRHDVWMPRGDRPCFDRIADPRRVYDLIIRETERWRREQYGEETASRSFIG